ncbi:FlgD immunoglobulin-like domain containing protein [Carboxydothermus ferrireducens]|uniref:Peptidoglycan/xylan/chitin deacetylase (PgdA/CDA1 family) n=1 Tax=Carboxydothermus ferrireducens DSM 11255 TaxID=1119529 RepID=A0ABX2R9F3_9THEO|nr:FlgD immunoglobulin-like domain containing protein [Carboxydothermus ferrireducens]NYE57675.1 peptidoglycan/xylan/chitin deacetylase (PgdA/CDA1 family) [Carboxydothermus ferrireducens DSM 11255]
MKFWLKIILIQLIIFVAIFTLGIFFIEGDVFDFFTPDDLKTFKVIGLWSKNNSYKIYFDSPILARGKIKIYNEANDLVREINLEKIKKGTNEVTWDGRDNDGNLLTEERYRFEVEAELYHIPVFLFHDIRPPGVDDKNVFALYPQTLDRILELIKEGGFQTATAGEIADYVGERNLPPPKPVGLIFIDGYKGFFNDGAGLLKTYDMKFSLFLITGYIGVWPEMMNWEEVRAISQLGLAEFGIEGHKIPDNGFWSQKPGESLEQYKSRIISDVNAARELVGKNLNTGVEGFLWKAKQNNSLNMAAVRQSGIKYQVLINYALVNEIGQGDIVYAYPVSKTTDIKEIEKRLNNIVEKKIIFKGVLQENNE